MPHTFMRSIRFALSVLLIAAIVPISGAMGEPRPEGSGSLDPTRESPDRRLPDARPGMGDAGDAGFVEGELLVRFKPGKGAATRTLAHARVGARRAKTFDVVPGLELVKLPAGVTVDEALNGYRGVSAVAYAQPNYVKTVAATTPNDPRFGMLWGLSNTGQSSGTPGADIKATDAWDVTTGSKDVVVAVLDTGIDYAHPDLAGNMWVNPGEIAGNGIDDDGNGHVDDVYGIDVINQTGDPLDDHGHGTHCAGTVGAVGDNGLGVTGVNWDVSIMAVKMLDENGSGTTVTAIEGFEYAAKMGADIISNSWGGHYALDQAEYDAIAATDALFVFAAGNTDVNNDSPVSKPHPYYPASYNLPNIIAVGASDRTDSRASFSNYGAASVDVFAPGVGVLSTIPGAYSFVPDVDRTLFSDDFNSIAGWDLSGSTPWTLSTAAYTSSPSSLAHGGIQGDGAAYADSAPIDCSDAETVFLNAQVRYDLDVGFDYLDVWVLVGSEWEVVGTKTGSSGHSFEDWWIDLTDVAAGSGNLIVSFGLDSTHNPDSTASFEGVFVDDARVVTAARGQTRFSDNFTSLGGWNTSSMYVHQPWALSSARFTSGPTSVAHTGYVNNEWSALVQTAGTDMSGASAALLRFRAWHDIEDNYDWLGVSALNDGVYTPLAAKTGDSGGWRTYGAILPNPGSAVAAMFEFESDEEVSSADGYEGVYIDDVEWIELSGTWLPADHSDAYASWNGTSMAAPHVSGIAALLLSIAPDADWQTLKAAILDSAEPRPALTGLCVTGARADAHAALLTFSTGVPPVTTVTGVPAGWSRLPATVTLDVPGAELAVTTDYRVSRVGGATGTWVLGATPPVDIEFVDDGEWKLEYRSQDAFGREAVRSATIRIDKTPPVTTTTANNKTFEGPATVTLAPGDGGLSGVASTRWSLDHGTTWNEGTSIEVAEKGAHTLTYYSVDNAGNSEEHRTAAFTVKTAYTDIAGNDRILTAVAASRAAFPDGADTVVIATARDWPDALGGTALAGVLGGPILLAERTSLPSATAAEIAELGAKRAIIVGGSAAIDPKVETALSAALGHDGTVQRVSGDDRYKTADKIALRVIAEAKASGGYTGTAFFATGANFPDALAAAPLAAGNGWPLFLVHPTRGVLPGTQAAMADVSDAIVLGGTGAVSGAVESGLRTSLGNDSVIRLDGVDRWETAVGIADWAVTEAGFAWNGVAITNGLDFPDALAGGVLQGRRGSVMLLTAPASLSPTTGTALIANSDSIMKLTFLGGTSAVSQAVRNKVREALD